ncbi:MAG: helix-turn-helix transcriptional regulator [Anaerolineae bacterium]|nr:helix-turn-helix transcriptional regulator [Anaerolineae bacterium]
MLDKFFDSIKDEGPNLPNKFTVALAKKIRKARQDSKMSQGALANRAHLRQSSISKIERGVRAVSSEEILYLSYALDKPINYFYQDFSAELGEDELTILEKELIMHIRQLEHKDLRKLIVQARALVEYEE